MYQNRSRDGRLCEWSCKVGLSFTGSRAATNAIRESFSGRPIDANLVRLRATRSGSSALGAIGPKIRFLASPTGFEPVLPP
jgi:hypothetical protein